MKKPVFITLAAVLIAGMLLWLAAPFIGGYIAKGELRKIGFDKVDFTTPQIGFNGIAIDRLDLHQDTEVINASGIQISWQGLNPTDIRDISVNELSLPLYLSTPARPLGMDLNLPDTGAASDDALDLPDITIKTTRLRLHYGALSAAPIINDIGLIRQPDGVYDIKAAMALNESEIEGAISLKGSIRSTQNYNLTLNLDGLSAEVETPLPMAAKRVHGWITATQSPDAAQPAVAAEVTYGILMAGGATFQSVTSTFGQTAPGVYTFSAEGYGADQAARISLFAEANTRQPALTGNIDMTAKDLSAAGAALTQYNLPDVSGALAVQSNFNLIPDPDKGWLDYSSWTGKAELSTELEDIKYSNIKSLDADLTAMLNIENRKLNIESDFKSADPVLAGDIDLDITGDEALRNFVLDGTVNNLTLDFGALKEGRLTARYDHKTKNLDYSLKNILIQPSGPYQKYPDIRADVSGKYDDRFHFNIDGKDVDKIVKLSANGDYELTADRFETRYKVQPVKEVSPKFINTVFPGNNFNIQTLTGDLSLTGTGYYQSGAVSTEQDIKLENITGLIDTMSLQGVNGVLNLKAGTQGVSMKNQELFIGGLEIAGLPLKEGLINFDYEGKANNLRINTMKWSLAGGQVTAEPFTLDLANMNTELVLIADKMALPQLFQLAPMEGLEATGTVSGRIPVKMRDGVVSVADANLKAEQDGVIRYNPSEMPDFLKSENEYIAILREALKNYNYDVLSLSLSGEAGKQQTILLSATGANPDFYDGRPVNLNLNLEGALDNLLKFNLGTYSIPDRIRKQLEDFEAQQ
ncbi:MAG: intermembrane phospholipid transport protein YdbH family protein [Pseudomonadota bacterium]